METRGTTTAPAEFYWGTLIATIRMTRKIAVLNARTTSINTAQINMNFHHLRINLITIMLTVLYQLPSIKTKRESFLSSVIEVFHRTYPPLCSDVLKTLYLNERSDVM